jgi:UDP-glucose 4-epimerase
MIRSYARDGVVNATILRIANVRGYGSKDTKYNSVFHQFIAKARNSEPIELWGALKTQRDLIYVKDVARAVRLAMVKAPSGLYNIGSGKGMTIEDEAREIVKVFSPLDNPSKFVYRKEIPEVRKHSCIFRIDKARQHFGWAPIYSYHDGLVDMKHEQEGSYACK